MIVETRKKGLDEFMIEAGRNAKVILSQAKNHEISLNKTLENFTILEAIDLMKDIADKKPKLLSMSPKVFKDYFDYINEDLEIKHPNPFKYVDLSEISSGRIEGLEKIICRAQLLELCEGLPNARDKFILLAVFENVSKNKLEELLSIRDEDVDFNEWTIFVPETGAKYNMSKELQKFARDTMNENKVFVIRANNVTGWDSVNKQSPFLIKPHYSSKGQGTISLKDTISRTSFHRDTDFFLSKTILEGISYNDIRVSGRIEKFLQHSLHCGMAPSQFAKTEEGEDLMKDLNLNSYTSKFRFLSLVNQKFPIQNSGE